jgi:hypothetical protein
MRAAALSRVGLLVLALTSTVHCGPSAPELAHGLSDRTLARLVQAPPVYAPASAAPGTETAATTAAFEGALEPQARVRVRHDPALDLAAAALAENFSDQGRRTSDALAQWLLWKSGSVSLYRGHHGGYVSNREVGGRGHVVGRPGAIIQGWVAKAAEHLNAAPGNMVTYGVARFTEGRVTSEMIVFGTAPFDVAPFSKTYVPGGPLTLALRPRVPLREIRVSLDVGDAVEQQTLAPRADGSFFFSRPAPARPGRYFLEVEGPPPVRNTLLTLPIYVGVPEPTTPDAFLQSPPPGPTDPAGWSAWLIRTYDAERARLGKPPLQVDARLSAMAADRSLAASGDRRLPPLDSDAFVAHLTATGFSLPTFVETVTNTSGSDAILLNLLRPSVRRRLLFSDHVLFGAAAAPRPTAENQPQSFSVVEETVIAAEAPSPPAPAPTPPPPPAPPPPPG